MELVVCLKGEIEIELLQMKEKFANNRITSQEQ